MNQLLIKRNNEVQKKKKKGFTLVELVIVIAIIAILAAMAIPRLGAMRQNARVSNDVAAAKNIATIASTMVANLELVDGDNFDVNDAADAHATTIRGQLDGRANTGLAEAMPTEPFTVDVADGGITVTVHGRQLFPDNDGNGRVTYAGDAR